MKKKRESGFIIIGSFVTIIGFLLTVIFSFSSELSQINIYTNIFYLRLIIGVLVFLLGIIIMGIGGVIDELRNLNNKNQ